MYSIARNLAQQVEELWQQRINAGKCRIDGKIVTKEQVDKMYQENEGVAVWFYVPPVSNQHYGVRFGKSVFMHDETVAIRIYEMGICTVNDTTQFLIANISNSQIEMVYLTASKYGTQRVRERTPGVAEQKALMNLLNLPYHSTMNANPVKVKTVQRVEQLFEPYLSVNE